MGRLAKKIAASVLAVTLVLAMTTTCFAAGWESYFGQNEGWYEGSLGSLTANTDTGWTANLEAIGWGGIWGGQVKKAVSVKKDQNYTISFTISSSNCNKWVYIKMAADDENETLAFGDWVQLTRGETKKYTKTFTAAVDSNLITFGIGGEMMDRESSDKDAEARYARLPAGGKSMPDADPTAATVVKLTNFSLGLAKPDTVKLKSVKALKGGKAKVTFKKVTGAKKYQVQYSLKKNMKKAKTVSSKKTTVTIKKLKKGKKYFVRVRVYNSKSEIGDWSNKKSVKVKK